MTKDRARANTPAASFPKTKATAGEESPVMTLFRQLQEYQDWMNSLPDEATDADLAPHYERLRVIEAEMMALPSSSAADFAAKAIVETCEGAALSDWEASEFWKEARVLTNLTK